MLRELRIRDFAIIDDLTVRFEPGLNVITGETGSGKSIIIGALNLLCGSRGGPELVRGRADAACIEALFDHPTPGTPLEELGVAADEELLIRRVIPQTGKGRVHINGGPVTVTMLAQLGAHLVHVYGQHDQALLLDPRSHLEFLDLFGELTEQRRKMADAFRELAAARSELQQLEEQRAQLEDRRDLLQFQVRELTTAGVAPDEEERLRAERELLRHGERLQQVCRATESTLYADDASMVSGLARLLGALREVVRIDVRLVEPTQMIESASAQLEEAALTLGRHADHLQHDPERLEEIEERLALMSSLAKKHRTTVAELPAILTEKQRELGDLESVEARNSALQSAVTALEERALALAQELSFARHTAATELARAMVGELSALGMDGARFLVSFQAMEPGETLATALDASGIDRIEFFLAANPGEPERPLARVASGGELSRIMLALKTLTAAASETPILIFDEVDAGIGGAVADSVARRLATLARTHQLLCITHLPQIAAHADHHLAVRKETKQDRTVAQAHVLSREQRVTELTRMLGGAVAPAEAQRYAKRLLAEARQASRNEPARDAVADRG